MHTTRGHISAKTVSIGPGHMQNTIRIGTILLFHYLDKKPISFLGFFWIFKSIGVTRTLGRGKRERKGKEEGEKEKKVSKLNRMKNREEGKK